MKRMALGILCWGALTWALDRLPEGCQYNKECVVEVPGSLCADGTASYYTITPRKNAKDLLVYMSGGGACWDKKSCDAGYAKTLTRKIESTNWNTGSGIHDASDKLNPYREYDVATIPYCTGDVYAGNKVSDYGSEGRPYVIRHVGYKNVQLFFDSIKKTFEKPEKVVLLGCSAGGIGAYYHLRTLNDSYPTAKKFVVSDAGTPFKPPYIPVKNYERIMKNWGADTTMGGADSFGALIKANTKNFPEIAFGFISSYRDTVMTFFAYAVGAPAPTKVVRQTIIDVADNDIGKNAPLQHVFFTESSKHCHTGDELSRITSQGTSLGEWLSAMTDDQKGWKTIRPDLNNADIRDAVVPADIHETWNLENE